MKKIILLALASSFALTACSHTEKQPSKNHESNDSHNGGGCGCGCGCRRGDQMTDCNCESSCICKL